MTAVRELDVAIGVERVSHTYEAAPVGAPHTPTYLNAAVAIRTDLSPEALKRDLLRPIEARMGRVRTNDRNAPRPIDIDIALVEDLVTRDGRSSVDAPDPDIERYAHLAFPLRDLDPAWRHPVLGRSLGDLADALVGTAGIGVREDIDLNLALERRHRTRGRGE